MTDRGEQRRKLFFTNGWPVRSEDADETAHANSAEARSAPVIDSAVDNGDQAFVEHLVQEPDHVVLTRGGRHVEVGCHGLADIDD